MQRASIPVVLAPLTLHALLKSLLTAQSSSAPVTLIVCLSRDQFLYALSRSFQHDWEDEDAQGLQQLIAPTLHNLVTARHVDVAFCASVQSLLAHLTAYGTTRAGPEAQEEGGRIVLISPLALHAPTSSFSAQGLSRTFAAATEAAFRAGANLLMVECSDLPKSPHRYVADEEEVGAELDTNMELEHDEPQVQDPWEQEIPILNVSSKRYGSSAGERPWAGRTVKVRRVASRWFQFQQTQLDVG